MPRKKKLQLPDNPTDEQIEAVALATIREVFEPDATTLGNLSIPGDGTWSATYRANESEFSIQWDGDQFIKSVLGATA